MRRRRSFLVLSPGQPSRVDGLRELPSGVTNGRRKPARETVPFPCISRVDVPRNGLASRASQGSVAWTDRRREQRRPALNASSRIDVLLILAGMKHATPFVRYSSFLPRDTLASTPTRLTCATYSRRRHTSLSESAGDTVAPERSPR